MAGRLTVEKFSPLRSVGIEERGAVAGLIDERGEAAGMTDHGEKAQATQKLITNVLDFSKKAPHDQIARFRGSERCSFKSFKSAVVGGLGQEKNVFGNRYIMGVAQAQNNIRRKQDIRGLNQAQTYFEGQSSFLGLGQAKTNTNKRPVLIQPEHNVGHPLNCAFQNSTAQEMGLGKQNRIFKPCEGGPTRKN